MESTSGKFSRLATIIAKLTGDKALIDEAKALVRDLEEEQPVTNSWWSTHGPERELSPRSRALLDYVVLNKGATLEEISETFGISPEYARRLVNRADTEMLERGGSASISVKLGNAETAVRSAITFDCRPPNR